MRINRSGVTAALSAVTAGVAGMMYERHVNRVGWDNMRVMAASPILTDHSHPHSSLVIGHRGDVSKNHQSGDSVMTWNKSQRLQEIMRHGYPSLDTIRSFDNYVLSYDRRNRTANWVMEHLTPELLAHQNHHHQQQQLSPTTSSSPVPVKRQVSREHSSFFEDPSQHPYFRSSNDDYRSSGYDRGHLAAAGNHKVSQSIMDQTFILSNISPQVGRGFNRDVWNDLEQYVRYWARKSHNLWVCTGPLYLAQTDRTDGKSYIKYQVIGRNQVSVPTHFFKVLLVENTDGSIDLESYVMQNTVLDPNVPLRAYQVPIDSIERAAGFLLFHEIPKTSFNRINGGNPVLDKFQASIAEDRVKRLAGRKG